MAKILKFPGSDAGLAKINKNNLTKKTLNKASASTPNLEENPFFEQRLRQVLGDLERKVFVDTSDHEKKVKFNDVMSFLIEMSSLCPSLNKRLSDIFDEDNFDFSAAEVAYSLWLKRRYKIDHLAQLGPFKKIGFREDKENFLRIRERILYGINIAHLKSAFNLIRRSSEVNASIIENLLLNTKIDYKLFLEVFGDNLGLFETKDEDFFKVPTLRKIMAERLSLCLDAKDEETIA